MQGIYTQHRACKHTTTRVYMCGRQDILMLDLLQSQKPPRHKCMSSCDWPNSLDFMLFDYWLVTVQHLMESQSRALLEADAKALCLG